MLKPFKKCSKEDKTLFLDMTRFYRQHPKVRQMRSYIQHHKVDCYEHSIFVTFYAFYFARKWHLNVNLESVIKGAMLHDFFLYDWHHKGDRKGLHGLTHPKVSLSNAEKIVSLSPLERDIIGKHMFPLTPVPPKYKESWLVTMVDKYCSFLETIGMGHAIKKCVNALINEDIK